MTYTREYLESIFYNNFYFNSSYVRNKKCTWNIFLSDRSDGKTFDCKIQSLIDFILNDYAHIYVRRYESELTTILKQKYFTKLIKRYPIINDILDFKYDDIGILCKFKNEENYRYIVYFIPLSMTGKLKSQIEDERIMFIDFDEYIPLDNKYLKNEMTYCLSLYRTIDRDRDIVQFSFFGNKIVEFNPFFDFFNLQLDINDAKIRLYKENTIAVQVYHSNELQDIRNNSKFYKSIKGTAYDDFFNGAILSKNKTMNIQSIKDAKYYISFKTELGEGSIWYKDSLYIISDKKYGNNIIVTDKQQTIANRITIYCLTTNFKRLFKELYNFNLLAYTSTKANYIFQPILRKINLN